MDTGGSCSIMDLALARGMGLPITMAQSTEFGMFTTPGRLAPMAYPAAVMGPIDFKLSGEVTIVMSHLRLVDHGCPLFILGADVLCEGDNSDLWEFRGMGPG